MAEQGKKLVMGISIYLIAKQLLNVILGAGVFSMILPVVISVAMYLNLWQYTHYAAAAILALIAVWHLPANLGGLPGTLIYLIEGLLDLGAAAVLILSQDVKAYFQKTE